MEALLEARLKKAIETTVDSKGLLPRILRLGKMIKLSEKEIKALTFIILMSTGHKSERFIFLSVIFWFNKVFAAENNYAMLPNLKSFAGAKLCLPLLAFQPLLKNIHVSNLHLRAQLMFTDHIFSYVWALLCCCTLLYSDIFC